MFSFWATSSMSYSVTSTTPIFNSFWFQLHTCKVLYLHLSWLLRYGVDNMLKNRTFASAVVPTTRELEFALMTHTYRQTAGACPERGNLATQCANPLAICPGKGSTSVRTNCLTRLLEDWLYARTCGSFKFYLFGPTLLCCDWQGYLTVKCTYCKSLWINSNVGSRI